MISHNLYFQIIFRVLLMAALAMAAGWLMTFMESNILALMCLLLEIPLVLNMITYLNTTNRKISYFMESVQNNDSSLLFPTNSTSKPIRELYQGLNKVNLQIQKLKIENQQHEQYFQALIEHVATGIVTFNSKGFVLHANSAAKKMLAVKVLTHIHQLERINRNLFQTVQNIKPFEQKLVTVVTERTTIELSLKATSFKTKDNELILLSIQDIRNELDEKEVESWQKLFRILSHEIMNSIAPITSLAQSITKSLPDESEETLSSEKVDFNRIRRIATTIEGQSNLMMSFVEKYRKLYKIPEPDIKPINVADWLSRFRILYHQEMIQKGIRFDVIQSEVDHFYADDNLISQVIVNLLKNAQQALTASGNGIIRLSVTNTDEHILIAVEDNGPGIPEKYANQIFMPFFTTNPGGNGIGLAISRQIVLRHGGTITFSSVPEKGTKFSILL